MYMKLAIGVGVTAGSIMGGWLGSLLDAGSTFGFWGIIGSLIGGLFGIYAGYKFAQYYI